jgi:hypothetical protein
MTTEMCVHKLDAEMFLWNWSLKCDFFWKQFSDPKWTPIGDKKVEKLKNL